MAIVGEGLDSGRIENAGEIDERVSLAILAELACDFRIKFSVGLKLGRTCECAVELGNARLGSGGRLLREADRRLQREDIDDSIQSEHAMDLAHGVAIGIAMRPDYVERAHLASAFANAVLAGAAELATGDPVAHHAEEHAISSEPRRAHCS